ncbi:MAG TPA: class I SAM-dependent methyltransferase [Aggregatilineales bacterium]|nr:class I SAM-dependent methyltransferase [Aggregatilineales bacterium]
MQEWQERAKVLEYLARKDSLPYRQDGEATLLDLIPPSAQCILDLGTGDGRLLGLVKARYPHVAGLALDFSPPMLEAVRQNFAGDPSVTIIEHDLGQPLPPLDAAHPLDAIVSSFVIHHLPHDRKRALYAEIFDRLAPGGVFCNLEHVASPSPRLHDRFLQRIGRTRETEDRSNKLLDMETQLRWLREIGFQDVDCYWKWLEYGLLAGVKPA